MTAGRWRAALCSLRGLPGFVSSFEVVEPGVERDDRGDYGADGVGGGSGGVQQAPGSVVETERGGAEVVTDLAHGGKGMASAFEEWVPTVERPVALVVEASFDSERFTVDTTTIDGQRVVVMQQRDGVRYLTAAETLALSRALLSRLAYVGFPEGVTE